MDKKISTSRSKSVSRSRRTQNSLGSPGPSDSVLPPQNICTVDLQHQQQAGIQVSSSVPTSGPSMPKKAKNERESEFSSAANLPTTAPLVAIGGLDTEPAESSPSISHGGFCNKEVKPSVLKVVTPAGNGEVAEDVDEEEEAEEENAAEDTDSQKDEELEGEEKDEDIPNFQLSLEYLDLAKFIYIKFWNKPKVRRQTNNQNFPPEFIAGEHKDDVHLPAVILSLALTSNRQLTAVEDLENALKIQQKFIPADDRLIAETNYQLCLAYGLGQEFELAIKHYRGCWRD